MSEVVAVGEVTEAGVVATVIHPAWQEYFAENPDVIGFTSWVPGAERQEGSVWDWEVALWMHVRGYSSDVQRVCMGWLPGKEPFASWAYPTSGSEWYRYILPPYIVEASQEPDEERLPVNPDIAPFALVDYHARNVVRDPLGTLTRN